MLLDFFVLLLVRYDRFRHGKRWRSSTQPGISIQQRRARTIQTNNIDRPLYTNLSHSLSARRGIEQIAYCNSKLMRIIFFNIYRCIFCRTTCLE